MPHRFGFRGSRGLGFGTRAWGGVGPPAPQRDPARGASPSRRPVQAMVVLHQSDEDRGMKATFGIARLPPRVAGDRDIVIC
ncbi:Opaque-specific ABC transporter CDR3 [Frankliniella fusca]|uniref:Opaque-specific ABC transporter CDR3 n=1 Tax=Frankliniella fusca TaxID=407009 RepID=A0AAE1HGB6_9NEOP|nr:Opaque-specific ABC transporter CDR3 [Frankliniella fusca]